MNSDQEDRLAKSNPRSPVKDYFLYQVIWLLPMTQKRRAKWANVRARGLSWYMLKHILGGTILTAVSYSMIGAISSERNKMKVDFIVGAAIGAVGGMTAYLRWVHNEVEYLKRPEMQKPERDY